MLPPKHRGRASDPTPLEEAAAAVIARRDLSGEAPAEGALAERRLLIDPLFADAVRRVECASAVVDRHAGSAELVRFREQALARARRAHARRRRRPTFSVERWRLAASLVGLALVLAVLQLSPWGYRPGQYRTGQGEQRVLELEDQSRIVLDSRTQLRVRFNDDVRLVQLLEGQAQFSVGPDPRRPFKVQVGERTIVALGTDFTVEYVDHEMYVAMLEGKVAVFERPGPASAGSRRIGRADHPSSDAPSRSGSAGEANTDSSTFLVTGEALRVSREGHTMVMPKADLEAAMAWRHGKVVFRNEKLADAVRRMNRYSQTQIEIDDPGLALIPFSGVFDTGDARTFAEAVQGFLPVALDTSSPGKIRLRPK